MRIDELKVGDWIIRPKWKSPAEVTEICGGYVHTRRENGRSGYLYSSDLGNVEFYEEIEEANILFSFIRDDGTVGYASHIGTDTNNNMVLEEKGTSRVVVKSSSEVTEVLPYTFECMGEDGRTRTFQGPNSIKKGDHLIEFEAKKNGLLYVTATDTKAKTKLRTFNGYKLRTEKLT